MTARRLGDYDGSLSRPHAVARDTRDLENRLLAFYGIGPVTMNIVLRELRPFWAKANPDPLPAVKTLANQLSIDLTRYERNSLTFARLEAGLIRQRRELIREATRGVTSAKSAQPTLARSMRS